MRTTGLANLTHDPELQTVQVDGEDRPLCKLRVAMHQRGKTTGFITVIAWGPLAERCAQYLRKGRQIHIDGLLQIREWETNGQRKQAAEIVADTVDFLSNPQTRDENDQPKPQASSDERPEVPEDDIPF